MLIGVLIIVIVRLVLFLAQDEKATQNQVRYPKAYLGSMADFPVRSV